MFFNREAKDNTAVAIENERRRRSVRRSIVEAKDVQLYKELHPEEDEPDQS